MQKQKRMKGRSANLPTDPAKFATVKQQQHQQNLNQRVQALPKRTDNDCAKALSGYVMNIVDPETSVGLKFPDSFSEQTSSYRSLVNFFLPVALKDHTDYPAGSYYYEVHPEVENTVMYLDEISALFDSYAAGALTTFASQNNFGFYRNGNREKGLLSEGTYQIAIPFVDASGVPQTPSYATPSTSSVFEPGFYNLPCRNNTPLQTVSTQAILTNFGATGLVTLSVFLDDGTAGPTTGALSVLPGIVQVVSLPGFTSNDARFAWKYVLKVGPGVLLSVSMNSAYTPDFLQVISKPLPDVEQLRNDVEKFRVVAQSALATYVGSMLTNAGDASVVLYRGGVPAGFNQVFDYSSIAQLNDSYEGRLSEGTYAFWQGQDWVDYSFRTVNSDIEYRRPYIVSAGLYNGDPSLGVISNANFIRLRICTVIEFTSRSQIYQSTPSPVCPELIAAASQVLSGLPNCMENGEHWDKLKEYGRKAMNFAKKVGRYVYDNREVIMKGAEAIGALAPFVLI